MDVTDVQSTALSSSDTPFSFHLNGIDRPQKSSIGSRRQALKGKSFSRSGSHATKVRSSINRANKVNRQSSNRTKRSKVSVQKRRFAKRIGAVSRPKSSASGRFQVVNRPAKRTYGSRATPQNVPPPPPVQTRPIQADIATLVTSSQCPTNRGSRGPVSSSRSLTGRRYQRSSANSQAARSKLRAANNFPVSITKSSTGTDSELQDYHEAFIRSFAIPTHLYSYLAQRHRQKPLYLDRNLSYLQSTPPSFSSNNILKSCKENPSKSIDIIADRLLRAEIGRTKSATSRLLRKPDSNVPVRTARPSPIPPHWPHEVQLVFEGLFDSESETDWVTVEASVGLYFRFGWSWRHKASPTDTIVAPFVTSFPLTCSHPSNGLAYAPVSSPMDGCRFQPMDLINRAKWLTSGSRLNCGQLELQVSAIEKRWLKRPDLCRANGLAGSEVNGLEPPSRTQSHANRKGGLASASYPVHYSTAPLPLFYPSVISTQLGESHPFLLTPGLYELRLGVDHRENYVLEKALLTSDSHIKSNGHLCNGGYHNETGSTADSVGTSTSDFPTGTISSVDELASLTNAGAASGRVEWRRVRFPNDSDAVDEYSRWPRLRFRVIWHGQACEVSPIGEKNGDHKKREQLNGSLETRSSSLRSGSLIVTSRIPTKPLVSRCPPEIYSPKSLHQLLNPSPSKPVNPNERLSPSPMIDGSPTKPTPRPRKSITRPHLSDPTSLPAHPVSYKFVYMGQLQQWSESKDLVCPWCQLDCWRARARGPEALLVHLRTCHPRFRFKASWSPSRSHLSLEVSLNEAYDGSNDCGLRRWTCSSLERTNRRLIPPGQLIGGWTGLGCLVDKDDQTNLLSLAACAVRVPNPVRRLPYTHLIFWRGAERMIDQPLDPTLSVRPMAVGHNRVYYHTRSVQPVRACEFEVDSEAEDAPDWLRQHYQRKVEEFTDVNQGEKQIMQLWNTLLLSVGPSELIVCDSQVPNLASYFLHRYASLIHRRRLRNNLLLHFANLVDYGLLSSGQLRQLISLYDKLVLDARL